MTKPEKTVREKIDDAKKLCRNGYYIKALESVNNININLENATDLEIKEISVLKRYLMENIAEKKTREE